VRRECKYGVHVAIMMGCYLRKEGSESINNAFGEIGL